MTTPENQPPTWPPADPQPTYPPPGQQAPGYPPPAQQTPPPAYPPQAPGYAAPLPANTPAYGPPPSPQAPAPQAPQYGQAPPPSPFGAAPTAPTPYGETPAAPFGQAAPPPYTPVPAAPAKKSGFAKIGGIAGLILVVVVGIAVKAGIGGIANWLSDGDSGTPLFSAPDHPFDGTVADGYEIGEAGIKVPAATAVDGFTEDEVAAALDTVKQALIAGRLDESMLYDHDRTALKALFSPAGAEELDTWFDEKIGGIVATMIAPGFELTDHGVRVSGEMTFQATTIEDGIAALEVHTNFVWVYPFTGDLKEPGDHLVTVRDDNYWIFPVAAEVVPEWVGMYLDFRSQAFSYNIDCDLLDADLIALGKPEIGVGGGVDQDDVMDPNGTLDLPDTC